MSKNILVVSKKNFLDQSREILSQLPFSIEIAINRQEINKKAKNADGIIFDDDAFIGGGRQLRLNILGAIQQSKKDFIVASSRKRRNAVLETKDFGAVDYITKPFHYREFIARLNAVINKKTRISCIGGGTGLFNLLLGLKTLPNVLLTSIVSMADDGGSSGRLRASFGVLPPGDVRRSLVALSNAPEFMNQVMRYRFQKGGELSGHNFGNLFLTVLAEIKGTMLEAIKGLGDILNIQGIVLPVASAQTILCAQFEDNTVIMGESKIDLGEGRDPALHIRKIWHEPKISCDIDVYASIINSDFVIIGPGDLFTSIITNLLVKNIKEAIIKTKAKKVYICNLMTKPGETTNYNAIDHVKQIIKYLGGEHLDYIIISNTQLSRQALVNYAKKQQYPVEFGDIKQFRDITAAKIILTDVGHETDLVRHDSTKLKIEINKIIELGKTKGSTLLY